LGRRKAEDGEVFCADAEKGENFYALSSRGFINGLKVNGSEDWTSWELFNILGTLNIGECIEAETICAE
jgi:hypothetical protein